MSYLFHTIQVLLFWKVNLDCNILQRRVTQKIASFYYMVSIGTVGNYSTRGKKRE